MKPICPGCKVEMHKAGFQFSGRHRVQRYKCNKCGYAATETNKNIWEANNETLDSGTIRG